MTPPWLLRRGALATLVCLLLSGCALGSSHAAGGSKPGSGTQAGPVSLNLIAPTTGATVGVRAIDVVGTVQPASAVVEVAGRPAKVSGGNFKQILHLDAPATTIKVTAQAPGYAPSTLQTVVRYSPDLAVALAAARRAVWTVPASAPLLEAAARPTVSQPRLRTTGVLAAGSSAAIAAAVGSAGSSASTSSSSAGSATSGLSQPSASTRSSTSTPSSGSTASSGSATSSGSSSGSSAPAPSSSPTRDPAPASNSQPTVAQIHQAYLDECRKASGGQPAGPYCTCMYNHLLTAGALSSRTAIESMERAVKAFDKTHVVSRMPAYLRTAQVTCVSKMPTPKLPVAGLAPLRHAAVPAPSAG